MLGRSLECLSGRGLLRSGQVALGASPRPAELDRTLLSNCPIYKHGPTPRSPSQRAPQGSHPTAHITRLKQLSPFSREETG